MSASVMFLGGKLEELVKRYGLWKAREILLSSLAKEELRAMRREELEVLYRKLRERMKNS